MIPYIKFQTKNGSDSVISGIDTEGHIKSTLGPISDSIIEDSINDNIVLIFSQGDLNLTPLIASLFIESKSEGDVVIGIPANKYNKLNKIYHDNFFSLTRGDSHFIYKDALWCSVSKKKEEDTIKTENDDKTTFILNDIQTKPKYGKIEYRKYVENSIKEGLKEGTINKNKFILTFRLDTGFENIGLDNTSLLIENKDYKLRPINPKLIILESVNDTMYNLNPIIPFIKYLIKNGISAVIHFSWPYINGFGNLLQSINKLEDGKEKIKIFQLGKRFSLEIKDFVTNSILKSTNSNSIDVALEEHPAFKQLSLEGKKWEYYYTSTTNKLENIAFCVPIDLSVNMDNFNDFLTTPSEIDTRIEETKQALNEYKLQSELGYILKYMPFVNSFVPPTELKYTIIQADGTYSKRNILDIISNIKKRLKDDIVYALNSEWEIINSISETLNLSDYMHNIKTPMVNTKYSAVFSFLLKSFFEVNNMDIIICDYNSKSGFKKYMSDYICRLFKYIKKNLPFSYDKLPKNDFIIFSSINNIIEQKMDSNEITKFDFEKKKLSEFVITFYTKSINGKPSEKKININLENMKYLYNNLNYYDYKKTILLLPGPLLIGFDGEVPVLPEGIDLYIRPFHKIITFVNHGMNYNKAIKQITTIKDFLFGDILNRIAKKDLEISYNLNNSLKEKLETLFTMPGVIKELDVNKSDNNIKIENSLNEVITEEFLENEKNMDVSEYKTLKELWESISNKKYNVQSAVNHENTEEFSNILVRFEKTGIEEVISIRSGTYIRLIDSEDDEPILIDNIKPGQRIAYIESESKDSLDNYLIKEYAGYLGITIEEVLEPYKCLYVFYNTISNINFSEPYSEEKFNPLYWLGPIEKKELYDNIRFLMQPGKINISDAEKIRTHFKNSIVWNSLSELEDKQLTVLKNRFAFKKEIDIKDLYYLAKNFGFELKGVSFMPLLRDLADNKNKYFFRDEKNLLAISVLIHYNKIVENYEELTYAGKNILKLLQQIGKSLRRVVSDKKKALNEMDLLIEEKVMVCTVLGLQS